MEREKAKLIPTPGKWEVCRRKGLEREAGPGDGVRQVGSRTEAGEGAAGKEGRRRETEGRGTRKWQGKGGEERAGGGACVPSRVCLRLAPKSGAE